MRVRINSEEFPSKEIWLKSFSSSLYYKSIVSILNIMYQCLRTNANTIGFALVRYEFEECIIILQNQYPYGWVLDININY